MDGLVDAHTHPFPTEAQGRRWQSFLGIQEPRFSGSLDELRMIMDGSGIERAVMLLAPRTAEYRDSLTRTTTSPYSQDEVAALLREEISDLNSWGCKLAASDPRFIPFIGINVSVMSEAQVVEEMERGVQAGARGIKIIPPSMQLYGNDARLFPVYSYCSELKLPVLSQSGTAGRFDPPSGADRYGHPKYFSEVLATFPELTLILAHLGLGYEAEIVSMMRSFPNVYVDTSLRLQALGEPGRPTEESLLDLLWEMGTDRVLFGSNYPLGNPQEHLEVLNRLRLSDQERVQISGGNFRRIVAS